MSLTPRFTEALPFGEGKLAFCVTVRDAGLSRRPWRWEARHTPDGVPGKVLASGKARTLADCMASVDAYVENVLVEKLRVASAVASLKIGYRDRLTLEQTHLRGQNKVAGTLDDAQTFPTFDTRSHGKTCIQTEMMFPTQDEKDGDRDK